MNKNTKALKCLKRTFSKVLGASLILGTLQPQLVSYANQTYRSQDGIKYIFGYNDLEAFREIENYENTTLADGMYCMGCPKGSSNHQAIHKMLFDRIVREYYEQDFGEEYTRDGNTYLNHLGDISRSTEENGHLYSDGYMGEGKFENKLGLYSSHKQQLRPYGYEFGVKVEIQPTYDPKGVLGWGYSSGYVFKDRIEVEAPSNVSLSKFRRNKDQVLQTLEFYNPNDVDLEFREDMFQARTLNSSDDERLYNVDIIDSGDSNRDNKTTSMFVFKKSSIPFTNNGTNTDFSQLTATVGGDKDLSALDYSNAFTFPTKTVNQVEFLQQSPVDEHTYIVEVKYTFDDGNTFVEETMVRDTGSQVDTTPRQITDFDKVDVPRANVDNIGGEAKEQVKTKIVERNPDINRDWITVNNDGSVVISEPGKDSINIEKERVINVIEDTERPDNSDIQGENSRTVVKIIDRVLVENNIEPIVSDTDKNKIKENIIARNPDFANAEITVESSGRTTVRFPNEPDIVFTREETTIENSQKYTANTHTDINTEVDRPIEKIIVLREDKNNLTQEQKDEIKENVFENLKKHRAQYGGFDTSDDFHKSRIIVQNDGTAYIKDFTYTDTMFAPSMRTTTYYVNSLKIEKEELVVILNEDIEKIKVPESIKNNIGQENKEKIRDNIVAINPDVSRDSIEVLDNGEVRVHGRILTADRTLEIVRDINDFDKVDVENSNRNNIGDVAKNSIKDNIVRTNPDIDPAWIVVDDDGAVTITESNKTPITIGKDRTVNIVEDSNTGNNDNAGTDNNNQEGTDNQGGTDQGNIDNQNGTNQGDTGNQGADNQDSQGSTNTQDTTNNTTTDKDRYTPTTNKIIVEKGRTPQAIEGIQNHRDLPNNTRYDFIGAIDTSRAGEQTATIRVTYPDNTFEDIEVPLIIKERTSGGGLTSNSGSSSSGGSGFRNSTVADKTTGPGAKTNNTNQNITNAQDNSKQSEDIEKLAESIERLVPVPREEVANIELENLKEHIVFKNGFDKTDNVRGYRVVSRNDNNGIAVEITYKDGAKHIVIVPASVDSATVDNSVSVINTETDGNNATNKTMPKTNDFSTTLSGLIVSLSGLFVSRKKRKN